MLGAIIGDIIGSVYEFKDKRQKDFHLFTPKSRFTDDTVMTLAVAKWLQIVQPSPKTTTITNVRISST